jgi:hypothetical protein
MKRWVVLAATAVSDMSLLALTSNGQAAIAFYLEKGMAWQRRLGMARSLSISEISAGSDLMTGVNG